MSIVNPTAASHSGAGACAESFLNPNAGTRAAEETKTKKYKPLCEQRGMDFVPIVNGIDIRLWEYLSLLC